MTETYNNFQHIVGEEQSVWGLVIFVAEQIFRKEFAHVRSITIGSMNTRDKKSALRLIWASIRTVAVAPKFNEIEIENTLAISASYGRFMLTHSN